MIFISGSWWFYSRVQLWEQIDDILKYAFGNMDHKGCRDPEMVTTWVSTEDFKI